MYASRRTRHYNCNDLVPTLKTIISTGPACTPKVMTALHAILLSLLCIGITTAATDGCEVQGNSSKASQYPWAAPRSDALFCDSFARFRAERAADQRNGSLVLWMRLTQSGIFHCDQCTQTHRWARWFTMETLYLPFMATTSAMMDPWVALYPLATGQLEVWMCRAGVLHYVPSHLIHIPPAQERPPTV